MLGQKTTLKVAEPLVLKRVFLTWVFKQPHGATADDQLLQQPAKYQMRNAATSVLGINKKNVEDLGE